MAPAPDREKALELALAQIDKQHGKGSVMRLGDQGRAPVEVIPTGSIALDVALGIGGLPRGRVIEVYGPESSGKCLTADTYVWTDRGLETVAELFERCGQQASCTSRTTDVRELGVRMVNERGELETLAALTHNNRKPVLRITCRSGRTVSVTQNHPLRVMNERGFIVWRKGRDIQVGDTLVSAAFGAVEAAATGELSEDEAVLLGYLVAEGTLNDRYRLHFTNWDFEVGAEFTTLAEHVLGAEVRCYYDKEYHVPGKRVREFVHERYGLDYVTAAGKTVPACVRTAGHKAQRAFLSALFEGDGWIDASSTVGLGTASEQLAREVQLMLYGLGVPASVSSKYNATYERDYWTVTVDPSAAGRFLSEVGFRSQRRSAQVAAHFRKSPRDAQHLRTLAGTKYTYEAVVSIEDGGLQPTFDVALPDTHSFIANGVLSHNTTVALHAVANAQRAGGIAAFIDAEHALDPDYAKALGVDTDALLVSQPDTGEQALEITDMLVRSGALDVVVIDSVAALVPRAEIEGEMGDSHVGLQARLMSQALRKITGALSNSGTTAIFINQLREKIGVFFGSPETTTGGKALKFYASVRLDIRRIETLKDGGDAVGNRTRVKVVKNKCVAAGTRVFDPVTGQTHLIEDVVDGQLPVHVVAADKAGMLHTRPVVSWFDQGEQDVMGLRLRDGTELWVTPDHKILTEGGWRQAGQLAAGDRVARPREFLGFGDDEPVTPEHLDGRYRGSQRVYLSAEVIEPVLSHLASRGVTAQQAAQLIGEQAGDPQGGMRQVLGAGRLRRDRLARLADALDDAFLQEILAEELCYSRIVAVLPSRRCRTFDIEIDELHNFIANDVVVHNCSPPFKQAEFDILYGHGISKEGSLIDMGVEQGVVRKSGAWYTYEGDQLGQGKENARKFLGDNPDIAAEVEKRIKDKLGIGAKLDDDETVPAPVDF